MSVADRQLAFWLFLLTFVTYAYFQAGGGWNQNSQFDLTRAIVERHTFAIDAYASNTGDVSRAGGHVYSNKSPALSWIAAIPYAGLYAMIGGDPIEAITLNTYILTLICVALPGALIPWMLYRHARKKGFSAPWSAAVALATALATQLLPYSTIFMLHVPSGALLLFAATSDRRTLAGFSAGLATAMNYLCLPALIILGVLLAPLPLGEGGPERVEGPGEGRVRFALGALAPLALLAIYQKICFGSFLTSSLAHEDQRFLTKGAIFGIFHLPSLQAIFGISVSAYRGLFYFAPVLIMAIGGAIVWFRDREDRRSLAAIVLIFAILFAINASFNGWEGGFGIGARYLVPTIPLLALAMLRCRGWLRPMLIALATISFAINFAATAVDPQPSGSIPRPLTQYIFPLLMHGRFSPEVPITPPWSTETFTGHTSVNRMTFDEVIVFARHPPGTNAAEWASFNLGEPLFGAGDARSLIPIALLMLGGFAAIAWKARSISRS